MLWNQPEQQNAQSQFLISNSNQRLGKLGGIKGLEIVDALAYTGVLHGHAQLLGDGDGNAARPP